MNRHQRRAVGAAAGRGSRDIASVGREAVRRLVTTPGPGLRAPVPESVVLAGGPMDGWVVKPTAKALDPGWHAEYSEAMRRLGKVPLPAGRYGAPVTGAAGVRTSTWQELAG